MSFAGLTTISQGMTAAGTYLVSGKLTIPRPAAGGAQSQVVATVSVNGTPLKVFPPGCDGFATYVECASLDVISVALTSSAFTDSLPNALRGVVSIG